MARDPLGLSAGDVNLYRYVGNNPVNWRDPSGLASGMNWWERLERGHYYGTCYGEQAVDWWADRYNQSDNIFTDIFYGGGGLTASLWTEDAWMGTASAFAGAGIGQVTGLSGMGPWIASVQFHGPHFARNINTSHLQVIIRLYGQYAGQNLYIYVPGINRFVNISIH